MSIMSPLVNFKKDSLTLQIVTESVIATHYGKHGELFERPKDQLMLNNDKIAGNVKDAETAENTGDVGKTEDAENVEKAEDVRNRGDTKDARKAENIRDVGDIGDAGDKKVEKSNNGAANGEDQEDGEMGNTKVGDSGDQEAGKPEDIEVGNDGVGDDRNEDNWYATIEDIADFDDGVTIAVDPIDRDLGNVLENLFGSLSPKSNLLPNVNAACSSQFYNNKFNFLFTFLLTLL